jgi:cobalamin biosynthesis protein CobC
LDIAMLEHGGNLSLAAKRYDIPIESWLDLSTAINPTHYPIPHMPTSAWQRLPEDNDGLIEAACRYYGCPALLPTAGSQAALQILPKLRVSCTVAMPFTMYQEHAHAWQNHGHTVIFFEDTPTNELLDQVDVVLVCNPNNPTGKRYSKNQLLDWHQRLSAEGGWLIVDEAFMDTTPEDSIASETHLAGLFVLRSLGKFFGLAGVRVGFLLAQQNMLTTVQEIIGPWSLTGPSRFVAKQSLLDQPWQAGTRQKLRQNSSQLKQLLKQYGLYSQGETDLFQYVATQHAIAIHQALAEQGVWVRLFKQTPALRFGLPTDENWEKLEQALKAIS